MSNDSIEDLRRKAARLGGNLAFVTMEPLRAGVMDSGPTLLPPRSAARVRDDEARRQSAQHDCGWQGRARSRRVREAARD